MNFQLEHIEPNLYEKIISMTTALAIKCKEGIILASDSQGSTIKNKSSVKKTYKINDSPGFIGSGDHCQIINTKNEVESFLKKNIMVQTI